MPAPPDFIERIGGASFAAGAHRALALDDPGRIYVVEQGHLDIFAAEFRGAEVVNRRPFATRVPAGSVALAAPRAVRGERVFGLLGVPSRSAVLVEGKRSALTGGPLDVGLVSCIDDWVVRLSDLLAREAGPVPRGTRLLEADPDVPCPAGGTLSAHHLDVVWMSADRPVSLMGSADLTVEAGDILPLSERTWVETGRQETRVSAVHTPRTLLSGTLWPAVDRFGTLVLLYSVTVRREESEAIRVRHRGIREAHRSASRSAQHDLAAVLGTAKEGGPAAPGGRAPAEAVMRLVADSVGFATPLRRAGEKTADPLDTYLALARGSAARARRITLAPGWWKRDGPSFAGLTSGDGRPIAVLSDGRGRYRAVDPASERSFRVGRREAAGIAAEGVMLYPCPFRRASAASRRPSAMPWARWPWTCAACCS